MNEAPNPFAPPRAEVADIAATGPEQARRTTRLVAALLDGLIQGAAFWVVFLLLFNKLITPELGMWVLPLYSLGGFVLFMLINGYLLAREGQTVGKKLLGLRIVRSDGSRATLPRLAGLRYGVTFLITAVPLVGGLYSLVDVLLIFRASNKCLHDNIADTIVVKA